MQFLIFLSCCSAVLIGAAIFLAGKLLLRLRITTIQITKGVTGQDPSQLHGSDITTPLLDTDAITDATNNQWQPYTINLRFGDLLPLLGWLLIVIGLMYIIIAFVSMAFMMNAVNMGGNYNIKLP